MFKSTHWFLPIAGIIGILLLIQLTRLVFLLVTPLGPVGDWRAGNVEILSPQSRLSLFSSFDPFFRTGAAQTANVVTSLQLTLYGIRMNEGSGRGSAILAGPDGVQESYSVGEEIMSGVMLDAVKFDHVIVDRGGVRESLYLDQSIPAQTVGVDEPGDTVQQFSVNAASSASSELLDGISFAPRNVDDVVNGIIISLSGNSSASSATGFRDGDIIVSYGDLKVNTAADIEVLKTMIRQGGNLSVMVERGADTVPVSVNLGSE